MTQWTIRVPEELAKRVRARAAAAGRSMNGWVVDVLSAAADPALASNEAESTRERLRLAGLLFEPKTTRKITRPSEEEFAKARRAAGRGTPLSEIVSRNRD